MENENTVGYTESINFRCLEDLQQVNHMSILNPLNLDYCGREACQKGYMFGPYTRENYVLHMVVKGCGEYRIGKKRYKVSKGQAFLIPPGTETVYKADREDPWVYVWLGFHGYKTQELLNRLGFRNDNHVITLKDTAKFEDLIDQIMDASQLTFLNEMKRTGLFYAALTALLEERQEEEGTEADYSDTLYVKVAVDTMVTSYNKKLRISDIARMIGINRSYLTNIFKKELGISPQEFLINFRLEKAAQMLRETEEPIGNIAITVGYSDSLSFSKAFKQKYGMQPSSYRKNPPHLEAKEEKGDYKSRHRL